MPHGAGTPRHPTSDLDMSTSRALALPADTASRGPPASAPPAQPLTTSRVDASRSTLRHRPGPSDIPTPHLPIDKPGRSNRCVPSDKPDPAPTERLPAHRTNAHHSCIDPDDCSLPGSSTFSPDCPLCRPADTDLPLRCSRPDAPLPTNLAPSRHATYLPWASPRPTHLARHATLAPDPNLTTHLRPLSRSTRLTSQIPH